MHHETLDLVDQGIFVEWPDILLPYLGITVSLCVVINLNKMKRLTMYVLHISTFTVYMLVNKVITYHNCYLICFIISTALHFTSL